MEPMPRPALNARMDAAIAAPVSGTQKALLLLIAWKWNGTAVGVRRLADEARVADRSVQRALRDLCDAGLLHAEQAAANRPAAYTVVVG